jgi:nucleotide-binding universal stress UspA family protein
MEIPMGTADKLMDHAARAVTRAKQLAEEAGVKCKTRVEAGGSPADNIVRYAGESETDLIVLGHRGLTALDRFVVGSVAGRVVAYAPCSVLVVR